MSQAALAFGPTFENVNVAVEKGRLMKASVVLDSATALREIPVFPGPVVTRNGPSTTGVRAFRVQGDELVREGLFDGDYLLVGPTQRPRSGALVLAEADGRHVLRRAKAHSASRRGRPIPPARIVGTFLGVIRRRGFGEGKSALDGQTSACLTPVTEAGTSAPSKVTMLRGQLGMLESTCAETRNPRLQRALLNEADRVRRQLQNEAPRD